LKICVNWSKISSIGLVDMPRESFWRALSHDKSIYSSNGLPDARMFVGRQAELERISALLTPTAPASVAILGPSRMGKTSLLETSIRGTQEDHAPGGSLRDYSSHLHQGQGIRFSDSRQRRWQSGLSESSNSIVRLSAWRVFKSGFAMPGRVLCTSFSGRF